MATSSQSWKSIPDYKFPGGKLTQIHSFAVGTHFYKLTSGKHTKIIRIDPAVLSKVVNGHRKGVVIHPIDKSKTLYINVYNHTKPGDIQFYNPYGSSKDFHKIGIDKIRNVARILKKIYPNAKALVGQRAHKEGMPLQSFRLKNIN